MIKEFLGVFSRATLSTKGNSTSIDSTLFIFDILLKHIQIQIVSYPLFST
jgi:hypothetical protein